MNAYEPAPTGSPGWFKSSFSDHGNSCVEVRFNGEEILIRDSKYRGPETLRPIIAVPADAWVQFLAIATGDADDDDDGTTLRIPAIEHDTASNQTTLNDPVGTTLTYTPAEWVAFIAGIHAGEFSPVAV